jgi:hypothetical protein
MPATIFAGSKVKTLKNTLSLNGGADIISSTVDPTSVATDGAPGSLLLNTTSGRLYRKNDSGSSTNWEIVGSGAGGINYVTNPDAESNTTGWSTYADAAGALPVDGAGGTANITWTRSTTSPLRGVADFVLTKDAVNRQGEGVATDLTINLADQAKRIVISLNYEILSGTYADGDIGVYMIADPAGTPIVIQPAGFQMQSLGSGTKGRLVATFQTQATGQAYRLCFHVASTSAAAYSVAIDTVQVGPQNVTFSTPVTDWVSYTPASSPGFGTLTSVDLRWRRVGGNMEIRGSFTTGTVSGVQAEIPLPAGYVLVSETNNNKVCGIYGRGANSANHGGFIIHQNGLSSLLFSASTTFSGTASIARNPDTGTNVAGTGEVITFECSVPITGWATSAQVVSDSSEGRVVAASFGGDPASATSGNPIIFPTTIYDTNGAYNATTGVYTAPVPGIYVIGGYKELATAVGGSINAYVDGAIGQVIGACAGTDITVYFNGSVQLRAGQQLTLRPNATLNFASSGAITVSLLQGSQTLLGGETVVARASTAAAPSIPNNSATTVVFGTESFDSTGSYDQTTGIFTAPVSGTYEVQASIDFTSGGGWIASESAELYLQQNGSGTYSVFASIRMTNTHAERVRLGGSDQIRLLAGENVRVQAFQNSGAALALSASALYNFINIKRIGNY